MGDIIARVAAYNEQARPAVKRDGLARAVRYGYCLVLGLGIGFQFSGYLVWAEGAKTPEGGAVAVVVTVLSVLTLLRWTR